MPNDRSNFQHLPLVLRFQGDARFQRPPAPGQQTIDNRLSRVAHAASVFDSTQRLSTNRQAQLAQREADHLPPIPRDIPILIKVDPSLNLDVLRAKFKFEIVSEQEDGFVIVSSEDIDLTNFREMVDEFTRNIWGSGVIAQVHRLYDDAGQTERLRRILSEALFQLWPSVTDEQQYVLDVGIACAGAEDIPTKPKRRRRDSDAEWASRERNWSEARMNAYDRWDDLKLSRENDISNLIEHYDAEILSVVDGGEFKATLPDSFTIRLRITGKGLKDLIFNYPFIFEVLEPEHIHLPQRAGGPDSERPRPVLIQPDVTSPAICVVDSGIQEGHVLLSAAIAPGSRNFLAHEDRNAVADRVEPGGHGTRVAGAVLFGERVPVDGTIELPFWIQNARVLNQDNQMPEEAFPPLVLREVVGHFHSGSRPTRIFNHSINATGPCRLMHMSAWAAEIDVLSEKSDILFIQSVGNLPVEGTSPNPGVRDHLRAGNDYPEYLYSGSARVANPGQSLQALTVGSVAYDSFEEGEWSSLAIGPGYPSSFSRSGAGIWDVIKPEVVEYGGDDVRSSNSPPDVQTGRISLACPELVRSTLSGSGPAFARDACGTSFAAPKVTRLAGLLERLMPEASALLYRALIVQSARWPRWAENLLGRLQSPDCSDEESTALRRQAMRALRSLGFGIPDELRATTSSEYRTTLIADEGSIGAGDCHIFQVPIPPSLRRPGDEFDVKIEVTLSYAASPRRTRRNPRRYLSTWLDWRSSNLGEELGAFHSRAIKNDEEEGSSATGVPLPWALQIRRDAGLIREFKRGGGTVQKDWATVKSNLLSDHFCVAVRGHQGWSLDPDSRARYALVVTLDVVGGELAIYDPLRIAVAELQTQIVSEVTEREVEIS